MKESDIVDLIPSISYALMFYSYGRLNDLIKLGYDGPTENYYEIFYEALGICADAVWSDYIEDYDVNTWYFSNFCMMEYYRLCRVYGSAHRMKLKDNPYMIEAERCVESLMELGDRYGYGWSLNTKINHQWASGIVFRTDEYFCGEQELIMALLEIHDWYTEAVYRLRKKMLEEGIICLPALPAHREAAV